MSSYIESVADHVRCKFALTGMSLAIRWKEAREDAGLGMNQLDRAIGQKGGYTSRIESGEKRDPNLEILERAAKVLGVQSAWLAFGEGLKRHNAADPATITAGEFLRALSGRPSLHQFLLETRKTWGLGTVFRVLGMTFESDSAGVPRRGWASVLDSMDQGKFDATSGTSAEVVAATKRQIGRRPKIPRHKAG